MRKLFETFESLEDAFNSFVKKVGGELIIELLPKSGTTPINADYYFRQQNIIIELKCLEKDHYQNKDDELNLINKIKRNLEKGYLSKSEIEQWINTKNPSEQILNTIFSPLKRTIEDRIRDAKKQILKSRELLQEEKATGLIFFANENNYFPPNIHIRLISDLIVERYQNEIDGFLYFTTDRNTKISQQIEGNGNLWLQFDWIKDQKRQKEVSNFIWNLGKHWTEFVCSHTNREFFLINDLTKKNLMDEIATVKFIR